MQRNADYRNKPEEVVVDQMALMKQLAVMGNELSFSAWMRTGVVSVASGLGIGRFLATESGVERLVGALFIVIGGGIFIISFFHYRAKLTGSLYDETAQMVPLWMLAVITVFLLLGTLLSLFLLIRM